VLDRRDFNDDLISSIEGAMVFLKQYIPVRYEMTGSTRRKEVPEIPYDALREALINAVVHRDYFEKGANVMVEMFDDRIEITNPGGLVKGLKAADFGKKSALRTPTIASLLHHANYIEKMGTGISKIRKLMKEAKLSPPKFAFNTFFMVTFKRPYKKEKKIEAPGAALNDVLDRFIREPINEPIGEPIKKRLLNELAYIKQHGFITTEMVENLSKISTRSAKRDLDLLKKWKIVEFEGAPKTGKYVLTEKGKRLVAL
jgi:ATP-dependent DNA helicase RecG